MAQPIHPVIDILSVLDRPRIESREIGIWSLWVKMLSKNVLRCDVICEQLSTCSLDTSPPTTSSAPIKIQQRRVWNVEVGQQSPEMVHMAPAQWNNRDEGTINVETHCIGEARENDLAYLLAGIRLERIEDRVRLADAKRAVHRTTKDLE